jgi:hypothetical protein
MSRRRTCTDDSNETANLHGTLAAVDLANPAYKDAPKTSSCRLFKDAVKCRSRKHQDRAYIKTICCAKYGVCVRGPIHKAHIVEE